MKLKIILEFDENDLGPKWMNPDSFDMLLYTDVGTKKDLLKVVSFEEAGVKSAVQPLVSQGGSVDGEADVKNAERHPYAKAFFFDAENIKFNWRMDEQQADPIHLKFTTEKLMDDLKKLLELGDGFCSDTIKNEIKYLIEKHNGKLSIIYNDDRSTTPQSVLDEIAADIDLLESLLG